MENLKFSVSMCVYGGDNPEWFKAAVDSILNQTVKPNEIVLVVDGPVPPELDIIIAELENSSLFKVVRFAENQGHGNARRRGLECCENNITITVSNLDYLKQLLSKEYNNLKVHIKIKQSVLYINVENSFEGEVKVKNKKILSTKKDIKNHGIGLESVKKIVDEMNGIIDINWKDEIFCVNIMCYLSDIKAFCEKC